MVPKNMPIESITMDNNRRTTATTFIARKGCTLSYVTLFLIGAFFVCTLIAVSFIVHNLSTCDQRLVPQAGEDVVCTTVHLKHTPKVKNVNEAMEFSKSDLRLPHAIKPLRYNISLVPFFRENFTYEGQIKINVVIVQDCYNITMHAVDLNIFKNNVAVVAVNKLNNPLRIRKQYFVERKQFFIIELYDKLITNTEYEISLTFQGFMRNHLQGFYRSSYKVGTETRWLASTQFQATDARRAFPCFDEPALKANITLNIARPSNMTSISNMPIITTRKHETLTNYVWDKFAESLPMSTYLIAFAISDFSHLSDRRFSIWTRSDAIQSAKYALRVGPKILKFLEEYFNIDFPLPKLDMIAIPNFQAGAMENWGLITYRETMLLYEEGVSATINKQRITAVIGHELAHQWFGNLVTPSWWSDIWLNEGFANYMEYITVDAIAPHWKFLDQFVVNELQNVFQLDAFSTSHKISVEVFNPDEISEIFDSISYGKGATIIRMMSHFLTDIVFRRGLSKYLMEKAYSSAEQDDLWHFLTVEAIESGLLEKNTTVKEIMDTWTLQVGYPVLKIIRDPNTYVTHLEQERFVFANTSQVTKNESEPLWWIPITYTTSEDLNFNNTRPLTWIPCTKTYTIEDHNLSTANWFIFNIQETGYYRVNYDINNWIALTDHLMIPRHFKEISPVNRAQLLDDVMNLARGGYLEYAIALNLSRYLVYEDEYIPWRAAIRALRFIESMFINQSDYDLLKNYLLKLIENVYKGIGFENDAHNEGDMEENFKRIDILNMACHIGHQDCIAQSNRHFQNWIQDPNPDFNNPISPNLRSIVYCSAIKYGTEIEWDFAFDRYLKASVSTEKELLLNALGCSRDSWILFRYLRRSISNVNGIKTQDVHRVFSAVANNAIGQQIAFDFLRNNWEEIKSYLGSSTYNQNLILKLITQNVNSKFLLTEWQTFIKNYALQDYGRTINQIIEQMELNVYWMERNYEPIVKWLKAKTSDFGN